MNTLKTRSGFSLIELMVVVAMAGAITAVCVVIFGKNMSFFGRARVRQQVSLQSRTVMDTVVLRLRSGKPGTLIFDTPTVGPVVPTSRIKFKLQRPVPGGTDDCAIFLDNGTVYVEEGGYARRALAANVTGLIFTGDYSDPAIVTVTLQIDAPLDQSNLPDRMSTPTITTRVVHMSESV